MDFIGLCLGLVAFGVCFGIGWWFLSYSLYRNLDERDFTVQVSKRSRCESKYCTAEAVLDSNFITNLQALWSLVFALSCNMLILISFEIIDIMDRR